MPSSGSGRANGDAARGAASASDRTRRASGHRAASSDAAPAARPPSASSATNPTAPLSSASSRPPPPRTFLCRPRTRTDIPDPPMDLKLLDAKVDLARYAAYRRGAAEREHPLPVLPDTDVGGAAAGEWLALVVAAAAANRALAASSGDTGSADGVTASSPTQQAQRRRHVRARRRPLSPDEEALLASDGEEDAAVSAAARKRARAHHWLRPTQYDEFARTSRGGANKRHVDTAAAAASAAPPDGRRRRDTAAWRRDDVDEIERGFAAAHRLDTALHELSHPSAGPRYGRGACGIQSSSPSAAAPPTHKRARAVRSVPLLPDEQLWPNRYMVYQFDAAPPIGACGAPMRTAAAAAGADKSVETPAPAITLALSTDDTETAERYLALYVKRKDADGAESGAPVVDRDAQDNAIGDVDAATNRSVAPHLLYDLSREYTFGMQTRAAHRDLAATYVLHVDGGNNDGAVTGATRADAAAATRGVARLLPVHNRLVLRQRRGGAAARHASATPTAIALARRTLRDEEWSARDAVVREELALDGDGGSGATAAAADEE